jgi:hypothetical protein
VTATFLCRGPLLALGKHFAENPRRSSRQSILCQPWLPREPFAEWGSRQNVCRVPSRLCRVLGALGKSAASGSASWITRPWMYQPILEANVSESDVMSNEICSVAAGRFIAMLSSDMHQQFGCLLSVELTFSWTDVFCAWMFARC